MILVNAMGDACPIPIVKTKQAIREMNGAGVVQTLVDNEIAVQNLTKMANQKGYSVHSEKLDPRKFQVTMTIGAAVSLDQEPDVACAIPAGRIKKTVVVIDSQEMGNGSPELGKALMKSFLYALTRQETLPAAILFYNGGAFFTCQESPSLEDIKSLEAQGVEILTCGTCMNFYGLEGKLQVGEVTNMYVIAEKMTQADLVVKP